METSEDLTRIEKFLNYFGVKTDLDYIALTNGGNMVLCNKDTEWQEFLGATVNGVAEYYAKSVGKPIKWIE